MSIREDLENILVDLEDMVTDELNDDQIEALNEAIAQLAFIVDDFDREE
jgi:hypothetical protein